MGIELMNPPLHAPRRRLGETLSRTIVDRPHILVVDDENGPRQALRILLKEDYVVHLAENVPQALEHLTEQSIGLVITDVRMPRQSGVDLLREVKALDPAIQVIIFTGYGQLETAVKAIEYGAFAYIEKPFDNQEMMDMVESSLKRFTDERERRAFEHLALEANRFATIGRVVSGMMHDLGSPLTVIGSQIEILQQEEMPQDASDRLTTVQSQVRHCSDMVRATMNFLQTRNDGFLELPINTVVDSCLEICRPYLREQQVDVITSLSDQPVSVNGDIVLLRQAVLNIVTNACQAMEGQSEPKEIRIKTWAEGDDVHLSISDSGPGVPEGMHESIFDTFFTTKGKSGTGLGLSVVQNVLRRHGGKVELMDSAEGGLCFKLTMPLYSVRSN